jgi:hypothetical protein
MEEHYQNPEVWGRVVAGKVFDLPTEPGLYRDLNDKEWTLLEDGRWVDHEGITVDKKYNPALEYRENMRLVKVGKSYFGLAE